jgi:hypothetical protein
MSPYRPIRCLVYWSRWREPPKLAARAYGVVEKSCLLVLETATKQRSDLSPLDENDDLVLWGSVEPLVHKFHSGNKLSTLEKLRLASIYHIQPIRRNGLRYEAMAVFASSELSVYVPGFGVHCEGRKVDDFEIGEVERDIARGAP